MDRILDWIKTNWHEESNMGKAKLGALVALVFLLISSMLPDSDEDSLSQELAGVPVVETQQDTEASRQAADAYANYEARVGQLEREAQSAVKEASAAYQGYETRVAELERERLKLQAKLDAAGDLSKASKEAAETYRSYERRVAELEQEKRRLQEAMAQLETQGSQQAAQAYADYEARVTDLEREKSTGQQQAKQTYAQYEARVAALEQENQALSKRLAAAEQALAGKTQRLAELEASGRIYPQPAPASVELKRQLQTLRTQLDQVLKQLEAKPPAE